MNEAEKMWLARLRARIAPAFSVRRYIYIP